MSDKFQEIVRKHTMETPVKLGALAQELGLEVFKSTLKPDVSGLIEPSATAPSGFRIRINRHEMVERQRFTLAHEIAHFLLHRSLIGGGVVDDTLYRSSLSSTQEVQANKLAAKLIMPDELVESEYRKLRHLPVDDAVSRMASLFRVSTPAMRIKLGV
jgi:Zn-dependent peptidase ImmA (M78 family)